MSLIVAIEKNNKVYMGTDSIATQGTDIRHLGHSKMFKTGKYLIGFAGSLRVAQVLFSIEPPEDIKDFPDTILDFLKDRGNVGTLKDEEIIGEMEVMQSNFLIGHKGKIYEIQIDFQLLMREESYSAIGEGRPYALGALHALANSKMPPKRKLEAALNASSRFCATVGGQLFFEVI